MEPLKLSPASKKISAKSFQRKSQKGVFVTGKQLATIRSKTIRIEKMLGKENSVLKKQLKTKRIQTENQKRKSKEEKFEKKPDSKKGGKKGGLSMPRIGFLERVKNFIGKLLLGFVAMKLLPYLPQLLELLPKIQAVVEFVTDLGIGFLNILGSVLEGAYALRDKTIGFIEQIGGQGAVDAFLKFEKAIESILTALIAIGGIMAIAAKGGGPGGGGRRGGGRIGRDLSGRKVSKAAQQRYAKRFGRDKFIERFGKKNLKNLPKTMQRSAATKVARRATTAVLGKKGAKMGLKVLKKLISPVVKRIPIIGGLIDFALNFFLFKEPLGRAAFAAIGSTIFGALGAMAGSVIPVAGNLVGGVLGGLAGDIAGKWLYDTFFSGKKPLDTSGDFKTTTGDKDSSSGQSTPATGKNMGQVQGAALNMSEKQAFATVYELAKKHGAKFPEIVAAQAMHETGYLSGNLDSVFNSTGRTNAFGQTGDRGYGTIPRAGSATGWTKYPSLDIAVKDNIALWHRTSNHPNNYEAFDTPIEGIAAVAPVYSPNADPANIKLGYTVDAYSKAMVKIMKSMGFDPYKANKAKDLSTDAALEGVTPLMEPAQRPKIDAGDGTTSTGTGSGGMYTGPAGQIGAGAAYHVDTKFHKSIGMGGMISAMDDLADAYAARGREIVFSGQGYARLKAYKSDLEKSEKQNLLNSAIDAHSHSRFMRAEGFLPFDYYIPNIGIRDLYHPSTEGAEILLPDFGGSKKVGALYSGYGRSADIYDSSGNHVAMTGHGDLRRSHVGTINGNERVIALNSQTLLSPSASKAMGSTLTAQIDSQSTPEGVKRVMAAASGVSERTVYEDTGAQTIIVNNQAPTQDGGGYGTGSMKPMMIPVVVGDDDYGEMLAAGQ